ncbi:hypothetical protein GEMRC1_004649 [Eukaryota sp. GEM-RC1]
MMEHGTNVDTPQWKAAQKHYDVENVNIMDRKYIISFISGQAEADTRIKPLSTLPVESILYTSRSSQVEEKITDQFDMKLVADDKKKWIDLVNSISSSSHVPFDDLPDPKNNPYLNEYIKRNIHLRPLPEEIFLSADAQLNGSVEWVRMAPTTSVTSQNAFNVLPYISTAINTDRPLVPEEAVVKSSKKSRHPIILVPSNTAAPLNIHNIESFLVGHRWKEGRQSVSAGQKKMLTLSYSGKRITFEVVSDPDELKDDTSVPDGSDWPRLVALILYQPQQSLRERFRGKESGRFFYDHKGLVVRFDNQEKDRRLQGLNIEEVVLSSNKRHLDVKISTQLVASIFEFLKKRKKSFWNQ